MNYTMHEPHVQYYIIVYVLYLKYKCILGVLLTIRFIHPGPSSPPQNVRHTVQSSTTDVAMVSVQWDPPVDNGGTDDLNYIVNISPSTQLSATLVTSTTVTITADYNVNYVLSIVATNCAGNSTTVEYVINIGVLNAYNVLQYYSIHIHYAKM